MELLLATRTGGSANARELPRHQVINAEINEMKKLPIQQTPGNELEIVVRLRCHLDVAHDDLTTQLVPTMEGDQNGNIKAWMTNLDPNEILVGCSLECNVQKMIDRSDEEGLQVDNILQVDECDVVRTARNAQTLDMLLEAEISNTSYCVI